MDMALLSVGEAAQVLGRDRSGLHRQVKAGQVLTDAEGRLVVVDGRLITALTDLVDLVGSLAARAEAAERTSRAAQDEVELLKLEYGEFKARSSTQLQAVVEAHEAAARAMRELAPRS